MKKVAFIISNIEEYGKFISFCIDYDICVFRSYWDEREKSHWCYSIDWESNKCFYSPRSYYENKNYEVVTPKFELDDDGRYRWCY